MRRSAGAPVLVVLVATACAVAACGGTPPVPDDRPAVIVPGAPGEPASVVPRADLDDREAEPPTAADVTFVSMMIPHHEQALQMAALAPDRSADPRVRAMADRIAGVQGPEIAVLRAWMEQRAPEADAGHAHGAGTGMSGMSGMASPAQLTELAAARGPAFDRMFLDLMIAHHAGALEMAGRVQIDGRDVRALQFADDVVATQTADIDRMRALYPRS